MRRALAALALLCGLFAIPPAQAIEPARIGALAEAQNFNGVILVSRGDTILYARSFGEVRPGSGEPHQLTARWRWASITKQLVATLTMQETAAGRIDLDAPIGRYWLDFANAERDRITVRHLLQHMSGLPDPEDSATLPNGLPAFYGPDFGGNAAIEAYCTGPSRAAPGAGYHYSNCNFIILGRLLERVTGQSLDMLIADRLPGAPALFPAGGETVPGFQFGAAEPPVRLASYGGAGGMNGSIFDLWAFDRALMRGELLDPAARDEMWTGDPAIGYAALGQWVFPAPLAGCATPQKLVERPGAIGGVQGRNYILPERDMVVMMFTNRSEAEFPLGHVARERGFAFELLSIAACPETAE
ncbi:serine hydrolase [Parasphingopyxis sp.]|uniref:serine hydrolase domain-containing protein n=1 Tax=Parasphingopyxis sp. TaxID=1920299 RepID=UPI0026253892|nr:serine hydrolase domain-containing protein [Parasphingopyxis sp.]